MRRAIIIVAFLFLSASKSIAQTRVASDFEIEQMQRQIERGGDFLSRVSARLNLGDLRMTRNEIALGRAEYTRAFQQASIERVDARRDSNLTRYATATTYGGLARAKLGDAPGAWEMLEEGIRFAGDDARSWNVYASAMTLLRHPAKAVAAARNAVSIATRELQSAPSLTNRLDLAVYQYALASSLIETRKGVEAERLLLNIAAALRSQEFDALRREIAGNESFEIHSSARGDSAAYVSLLNRSQLRLAALYESRGEMVEAKQWYERVLEGRSDDATALSALARLGPEGSGTERYYAEAFDANPFSIALIRDYRRHLRKQQDGEVAPADSPGNRVRRALQQTERGEHRSARTTLASLLERFPDNDVVRYLAALNDVALGDIERARQRTIDVAELRREIDEATESASQPAPAFLTRPQAMVTPSAAELRSLMMMIARDQLTPEQRGALDNITFVSTVVFDEATSPVAPQQTILESGSIDGVSFRFSEPTAFRGTFSASTRVRLKYRVLGATEHRGSDALLLEPLGLEAAP